MITQAKIKNIVNDFNGITVAVTSYQDRYRAILETTRTLPRAGPLRLPEKATATESCWASTRTTTQAVRVALRQT